MHVGDETMKRRHNGQFLKKGTVLWKTNLKKKEGKCKYSVRV
jgi:hypothetical protein